MSTAIVNIYRLSKAVIVLGWRGAAFAPDSLALPGPLRFLRSNRAPGARAVRENGERLTGALRSLGPTYIKLGQFLATRADIAGPVLAGALASLRDKLPPFPMALAQKEIEAAFGRPVPSIYASLGPAVAAASIAQVHKAVVSEGTENRNVAVKILRPGIERRFERDLSSFYFAARWLERLSPQARRLRPIAAVDTLAQSVMLELDLRLEAAAMSEMAENIRRAGDTGFRVPAVDWSRTARRVMTVEWIDAIPLGDLDAIDAAGIDRTALGLNVIRSFLKHAIRDGYFHADMHQGNLFADRHDGAIVAVDFGIVGRIGTRESRFLAEILYGFLNKNYRRIAEVHFEAGYVPANQDVAAFAQALRSIGEPIFDRPAGEISMARLLTQLFDVTAQFQMRMRPELILLQKTMVVVEGVARSLDPNLNIWIAAEPVVRDWMAKELGPAARLREAAAGVSAAAAVLKRAPDLLERGSKIVEALEAGAEANFAAASGGSGARKRRAVAIALPLWIATGALIVIAVKLWWPQNF